MRVRSGIKVLTSGILLVFLVTCTSAVWSEETPKPNSAHPPVFLLLIAEQLIDTPIQAWWVTSGPRSNAIELGLVENTFAEAFRRRGFTVVDHQALTPTITVEKPLQTISPDNRQAGQVGQLYKADFIVVGRAIATTGTLVSGSSLVSAHAAVSLRVVNTKTAEIVASGSEDADAVHANEKAAGTKALGKAAKKLAARLIKAINSRPGVKAFIFD